MREDKARRFAEVILQAFGHEVEFEIEVPDRDRDVVIKAFHDLGCSAEADADHPGRILIHCPDTAAVEPSPLRG